MIEIPPTWWDKEKRSNELSKQVGSSILKLLFKKQVNKLKESDENIEQEININIQWSIKWPDRFWNYVMSFDGKKILLDENLNDVMWLEFVWIMPYNDRYYICDIWKKCVFYDTQTWTVVEFAEVWQTCMPKIYDEDKPCHDEFLSDLCSKSIRLFPNENKKTLMLWFYGFLNEYYQDILWKDIDIEAKMQETSKFGKECNDIFSFLMWAYEYMYNWKITNFLAWKDGKLWKELKESEVLKEMYPDLYLAMRELDFLKNVLLDSNWNICGYVIIKDWICAYVQMDWTISQYDDFIWPDKYGNIITRQWDKKYFMNSNFQYPFCGFDEILWPDKNGNYILKLWSKLCFVSVASWKTLSISDSNSYWNEPNYKAECFDAVQWPDENNNYILKCSKWYFLVNGKWEKISDIYLLRIEPISGSWNYKASSMSWTFIIGSNWKVVK